MIPGYVGCETCPLRHRPHVRGHGQKGGLVVVAETPSGVDANNGRYLSPGWGDGKFFHKTFKKLSGKKVQPIWYTAPVMCVPEKKVPQKAIDLCADRFRQELLDVNPQKILLFGSSGVKSLGLGKNLQVTRGQLFEVPIGERKVLAIPTFPPFSVVSEPDLFRDYARDIQKLYHYDSPQKFAWDWEILESRDQVKEMFGFFGQASAVSFDIETTGFDSFKDKILSIGFAVLSDTGPISMVIPADLLEESKDLVEDFMRNYEGYLVGHNAGFDLNFLRVYFGDKYFDPKKSGDTMMLYYALDERGTDASKGYSNLGLKALGRVYYDIPDYHFEFEEFFALPDDQKPWVEFHKYLSLDVAITITLFFDLTEQLRQEDEDLLTMVYTLLIPGMLATSRMELTGAPIDPEYLQEVRSKLDVEIEVSWNRIQSIADNAGVSHFNPNSHVQVKKVFKAIGFDVPSGAKDIVQLEISLSKADGTKKYPPEHPAHEFVTLLLDTRQKMKLRSTYVQGLLDSRTDDNRAHPDIRLTGTDTGRLSIRKPALQTIPTVMGPLIKKAFKAPKGYKIAVCDYSQLELRIATYYCKDPMMVENYVQRKDIHCQVARACFPQIIGHLDDKTIKKEYGHLRYIALPAPLS